jgi:hypothetical protein
MRLGNVRSVDARGETRDLSKILNERNVKHSALNLQRDY